LEIIYFQGSTFFIVGNVLLGIFCN